MEENKATPGEKPVTAKPAVKPKDPLMDNGDGTVTDPNSGLTWKQSDAWLDMHKFYTWFNHREYVDHVNKGKFAGYDNWRIPSKKEAMTLHDKKKECMDKNGTVYFVDPIFAAGGAGNTWISECEDDKIVRYDWKTGVDTAYPSNDIWASMRLVRVEGEAPPASAGDSGTSVESSAETVPTVDGKTPSAEASTTTKSQKSGNGKKGPVKRNISPEEKALIRERAKAYAAKKKAEKG